MSETHVRKLLRPQSSESIASPDPNSAARRAWIQKSAAALTVLFTAPRLWAQEASAQEAPFSSTLGSMSSMTGSPLDKRLLEPTAALLNAILADSKPLRALQLQSIEPATRFTADRPEND